MCPLLRPWAPVPLLARLQPDWTLRNLNLALLLVLHENRSRLGGKHDQTGKIKHVTVRVRAARALGTHTWCLVWLQLD